ncbi:ATP-dependent DNA helicase pif1-like [Cotesia typhae]|uniref:ATP-dependent DNA helicase pif1-like n=1 Tax=Cotesia typhae TaxID=2053667 RepID=UPI003D69A9A4
MRGKLPDKIRNLKWTSGIRRGKKRKNNALAISIEEKHKKYNELLDQHVDAINWLKSHQNPWPTVEAKWNNTFEIRNCSTHKSVREFIDEWLILNDLRGKTLIRGPTSFNDLKTVEGVEHPTFQATCRALGLLEDDINWDRTLEEASIFDSPYKIRELFAIMLVFCQVGDPIKLWTKYRESLAEDIKRQMERESRDIELIVDIVYNQCLILLEDIVTSMSGKSLLEFGLPEPLREQSNVINNRQYINELAYDVSQLIEAVSVGVSKLNDDQKQVYDEVLNNIDSNSEKLFYLDAPGGTGKTFLINLLLAKIRSRKNIAVAVASSGIAATLIDGGKTAHSAFKLPLNLNHSDDPICNISKQSDMAHVLRETKIIVWDECTMAHKKGVEALNQTLQDIREDNRLMGGLTILLAGDFRQTLPVVPRGTRADEIKACLKSSILWPNIKVLSLKVNMRVCLQNDLRAKEFSELLIDIGNGNLPEEERKITIPSNLCETVGELITLIDRIYPNIQRGALDSLSWLKERAILTPINESADRINTLLIEQQTTEHMKYESVDTVIEVEETVYYPVEFLHTLNSPGIPPHILHLKIGTPIMLLRNLNPPKLCNGTRLQVKTLRKNLIEATIFTGKYEGENVFIPRIPLIPSDYHFKFKRLQFPVRVCFAMTINKAQGQSLNLAGVDLQSNCFSHGQFYVACSRNPGDIDAEIEN